MLPHFFRHYDELVDRYFVAELGSTDESATLLEAHPKVVLRPVDMGGRPFLEEERRLCNGIWKNSRGGADWVLVVGIDEFLVHADLIGYLQGCSAAGLTALTAVGYEMVADAFPSYARPLVESVTVGVRSESLDRVCVFNPQAITEINYTPGRHGAAPQGQVAFPPSPEILLLRYDQLGADYAVKRSAELHLGLIHDWQTDKPSAWIADDVAEAWTKLRQAATPVPGLRHGTPPAAPSPAAAAKPAAQPPSSPEPPTVAAEPADPSPAPTPAEAAPPAAPAANGHGDWPTWVEVVTILGRNPLDEGPDAPLMQLLRRYLSQLPVDEARYLRAYPDVAQAIEQGLMPSAQHHFVNFGYFEGRSPAPEE